MVIISSLLVLANLSSREPVVGVLTYPSHEAALCTGSDAVCNAAKAAAREAPEGSYVDSSYKNWLEAAGARVVPIRYDLDASAVRALYSKVNAILFTGGPAKPLSAPAPYFATASLLYDLVVAEAAAGAGTVPLWGTCLGLQTLSCIANGGVDVLGDFPLENYAYPLDFTAAAATSKLFGGLSERDRADFAQHNVTTNWHHFGIAPSSLEQTDLVPLATNVALNGETFVSALEGRGALPVFAVQFHPESVQWQAASGGVPAKSAEALRTVEYLGRAFVERARNNTHAFGSDDELAAALFERQGKFTPSDASSLYPSDGVYVFESRAAP